MQKQIPRQNENFDIQRIKCLYIMCKI